VEPASAASTGDVRGVDAAACATTGTTYKGVETATATSGSRDRGRSASAATRSTPCCAATDGPAATATAAACEYSAAKIAAEDRGVTADTADTIGVICCDCSAASSAAVDKDTFGSGEQ
jgi:hypothetical protein